MSTGELCLYFDVKVNSMSSFKKFFDVDTLSVYLNIDFSNLHTTKKL